MEKFSGIRNQSLSVRGMSRNEIAKLITDFIFMFLETATENRNIGVLIEKGTSISPYYVLQVKGERKHQFVYFNALSNLDDTSYQITTTSIVRGAEMGEFYSRHWQIRFQREAPVLYTRNKNNAGIVGLETKEFNIDSDNFNREIIHAFIEKEDGYIRQSAIKRFMKEYRRYEVDKSISNLVNLWIVINRFMLFSVKVGTSITNHKTLNDKYIPLRFTEIITSKKKNHINYSSVWSEYEIKNISR